MGAKRLTTALLYVPRLIGRALQWALLSNRTIRCPQCGGFNITLG